MSITKPQLFYGFENPISQAHVLCRRPREGFRPEWVFDCRRYRSAAQMFVAKVNVTLREHAEDVLLLVNQRIDMDDLEFEGPHWIHSITHVEAKLIYF